jgi:hypothetical protein
VTVLGLSDVVNTLKLKGEQVHLLEDELVTSVFEEVNENVEQTLFKSEIIIRVRDYDIIALLDTGSDITCISLVLWEELRQKYPETPVIPIKPFQIKSASGHKSKDIKQMILLPLGINNIMMEVNFVVIPNLSFPLILGFDWLKEHEVLIKLKKNQCGINIQHKDIQVWVPFHKREEEIVLGNQRYVEKMQECKANPTYKTGISLRKNEKQLLESLLATYNKLFNSKLGRANCYEHIIKMENHTPIVKKIISDTICIQGKG